MISRSAWVITVVVVLLIAGAYILWIMRPSARMAARSLSAAHHAPQLTTQPKTHALHVEGCRDDFIVAPGELVEPRVIPGSSAEAFHNLYGPETKHETGHDKPGALTWDEYPFSLTASGFTPGPDSFVRVDLNQGHVLETLDGIELGIDSFGAIFRKMRDKKIEVHESLDKSSAGWTLRVTLYSACGRKFRSEYTRTLESTPEIDRQVTTPPVSEVAAQPGSPKPIPVQQSNFLNSGVFMNKVIYTYTMLPSETHDTPAIGKPATHN